MPEPVNGKQDAEERSQQMGELVLASASQRRRQLMELLGIPFIMAPSQVEETDPGASSPEALVMELSARKAREVAEAYPDSWVIGADTEVCLQNSVLGKPQGISHARRMLQMLQGRHHRVLTGLCVVHARKDLERRSVVATTVKMRPLSPQEIDWYISTGEPKGKAGGYAIQGKGTVLIESIEGSYTNVVGLPLTELVLMLRELGAWDLFSNP